MKTTSIGPICKVIRYDAILHLSGKFGRLAFNTYWVILLMCYSGTNYMYVLNCLHMQYHMIELQGAFWVWVQPMTDNITLWYHLSLFEHIPRMIPEIGLGLFSNTVETLYNTIYYSKYFIELNFDKSTQYVAIWTHKRHPIPRPFGRAMECLLWVLEQKLIVL